MQAARTQQIMVWKARTDRETKVVHRTSLNYILQIQASCPTLPGQQKWSVNTTVSMLRYGSRKKKKKEIRGFSPQANYTDREIAAGQRS
jgi:hypothetical protein